MQGKQRFILTEEYIRYVIEVDRRVSLLCGDSGTGKSEMYRALFRAVEDNDTLVRLESSCTVKPLNNQTDWKAFFDEHKDENILYVVDEDTYYIRSKSFANKFHQTKGYLLLLCREISFICENFCISDIKDVYAKSNIVILRG